MVLEELQYLISWIIYAVLLLSPNISPIRCFGDDQYQYCKIAVIFALDVLYFCIYYISSSKVNLYVHTVNKALVFFF